MLLGKVRFNRAVSPFGDRAAEVFEAGSDVHIWVDAGCVWLSRGNHGKTGYPLSMLSKAEVIEVPVKAPCALKELDVEEEPPKRRPGRPKGSGRAAKKTGTGKSTRSK